MVFTFSSFQERKIFLSHQGTKNILSIDETFGNNYLCCVCYHSLTREKQFVLSFSSNENEDNLNFLFWDEHKMYVLDTGQCIYFIDHRLNPVASFEITTPLVGLYLVNEDKLLLLEEAFFRLVNFRGKLLKSASFDLIVDFSIENNQLTIQTSEANQSFDLA
jgi:hypothetical protein